MSYQALNWAVKQRVGSSVGKAILMALANYADDHDSCFPSHERLAREMELSDKSIRVHLKRLEDIGLIITERARDAAGRLGMIRYILRLDQSVDIAPDESKGERKQKKIPLEQDANGDLANSARAPVAQHTGAPLAPAVSEVEKPPASQGNSILKKDNPLSPTPLAAEPKRERETGDVTGSAGEAAGWSFIPSEPDSDPEFDKVATLWPVKDKLADAWALWEAMSPTDRQGAASYGPIFLEQTQAKRKFVEALATFLKGKAWRFAKLGPAIERRVEIKPFTRKFWAIIWRRVERGERVGFTLKEALRGDGHGLWVAASEVPTEADEIAMATVSVDSAAFAAWRDHLVARGIALVRPDHVPVIWCPSEYPPL